MQKRYRYFFIAIFASFVAGAGILLRGVCKEPANAKPDNEPYINSAASPVTENKEIMATIQINDSFNQKKIEVNQGDVLEIQLEESPTTSYRWEITAMDSSELELITTGYLPYQNTGIGGGGTRTLTLKAIKKPAGQLKIENRQSWSGDVYKTFVVSFQ